MAQNVIGDLWRIGARAVIFVPLDLIVEQSITCRGLGV